MSVGNPFNTNGLATEVAADAIQEMTVISGAFNAEYGKAMSGIVNLVTKEGGPQYEGSVSFYGGDILGGNNDIFKDPNELDVSVYTLETSLSGPLLTDKLRFFVSGRRDVDDGHIFGVREHLPSDSANFNPDPARLETIREHLPDYNGPNWYYELHGKPWYEYAAEGTPIPDEIVSLNPRESFNVLGKITFKPFSGGKIEYSHLQDGSKRRSYDFDYRYVPEGTSSVRERSLNHSLHWTHSLNDKSFYTARFSYARNRFSDFLYASPFDSRYVVDRDLVGNGNLTGFPGTNFLFGGNQKSHVYEEATSYRGKLDFTRQFGLIHEVKAGLDMQLHSLDRQNFTVLIDGNRYRRPTVEPVTSPSHDQYEDQRVNEYAAYAQDKLEFSDFIINAGLRFEVFDPNGVHIPNLLEPRGGLAEAETRYMVLPRVGVSFPITTRGIIHFSYGHFAQMPTLRSMYLNPEFEFPFDEVPTFGNTNLRPERTVQYEIGLQQQLTDVLAFDVTAYFKDIRDYLTRQQIQYSTIPGENIYNIYVNKNYANVKGVSFALTKRRTRNGLVSANVDYTYQIAEGDNDDPTAAFFNFLSGRETELEVIPLDFDQRHIISTTVTVSDPTSWGASFIGRYATGYPYSPLLLEQNIDDLPRSGRKPAQIKLDAHLYKNLRIAGAEFRAFAKIFNVLDVLNENFVFDDTGRATYSLSDERNLHATWEPGYGMPGVHTLNEWDTRPHYFSAPREVRVGVTLGF
jgi:outer membrane receptor protein involved in Fe transport